MERTEILAMLEKDIQTLGRNHNAEVSVTNVDDEGDFVGSIYKSNVPLLSDARTLAEAYGIDPKQSVENDDSWGYIGIFVSADTEVKEPDTMRRTLCGATRVYYDMENYVLPKQHKPDDVITILTGPHRGEKITYREWRERVAPIMRNVRRCMGAMFDGKSPRDVQWEEVS